MEKQIQHYLQRSEEMLQAAESWLYAKAPDQQQQKLYLVKSYIRRAKRFNSLAAKARKEEK